MFSAFTLFNRLLKGKPASSLHQFTVKNWKGKEISLSSLKGKKLLIVNTASFCGFTSQYSDLQKLYENYSGKDLVILAFPCNDFGKQEPGTEAEIKSFCDKKFGLSFEIMEKIHVKGPYIHPLYSWLTSKTSNGVMSSKVMWNFQKYLVDEQGHLVDVLPPWKNPLSGRITKWLDKS